MSKVELLKALEQKVYLRARDDFHVFVKLMAPFVINDNFVDGAHIRLICEKLQAAVEGRGSKRLQFFLPPGSTKTVIISNLFPAWYFGKFPNHQVLSIGHSTEFAKNRLGRIVRDLIANGTYQQIFPDVSVREDVKAAHSWQTNHRGIYYCTGAGSAIAGYRGHLGICDDVLSEQTAASKVEREAIVKEWYGPGFSTRILPGGIIIIVNTRWHLEDLSGWTLREAKENPNADQWEVVSIPAILNEESATLLGKKAGESYWPEYWPLEMLQVKKETLAPHQWNALYMQNPVAEEGNILKREYFNFWDGEPPECEEIIITMDTAFSTKDSADYSVIMVSGIFREIEHDSRGLEKNVPKLVVLSVFKGRLEFGDLLDKAMEKIEKYRPDHVVVEKKASGQSLIQELRRAGIQVVEFNPDKDKVSRVNAISNIVSQGRIYIPEGVSWKNGLLDELQSFPNGAHDDQVDALVMAITFLRDNYRIIAPTDWIYRTLQEENPRGRRGYWH